MKKEIKDELKKRMPSLLARWNECTDVYACCFCSAEMYAGNIEISVGVDLLLKHKPDCFGFKLLAELSA